MKLPRQAGWQEKGQGLVEYALILVLVAVVVIVALFALAPALANTLANVQCSLKYRQEAYAEWSDVDNAALCFEDVLQPDGSKLKTKLGTLFD